MNVVLIVEDDLVLRNKVSKILATQGWGILLAGDGIEALEHLRNNAVHLIIAELHSPAINGLDLLRRVRETDARTPFIVLREPTNITGAVEALQIGADDTWVKPLAVDEIPRKVERILERANLVLENALLKREREHHSSTSEIVGTSDGIDAVRTWTRHAATTRSPALIVGETGTGRTLVARTIHGLSSATPGAFATVYCGGISEHELEAHLFGRTRGTSDSALPESNGLLRSVRSGTVFLKNIDAIPMALQSKLAQAMATNRVCPVGSTVAQPFNARIIASASHRLSRDVDKRLFDGALYAHFLPLECLLPPLRDRRSDVPLLAAFFISHLNSALHRAFTGIDRSLLTEFSTLPWKGNVRELRGRIELAMIVGSEPFLKSPDGSALGRIPAMPVAEVKDLKDAASTFERDHIRRIIAECQGNKREAARALGVSLSSLYRHLDLKGPV
ncbi:MAG: sigma 54-interacting transcriptional regulator [Planctomycetota bacterium]